MKLHQMAKENRRLLRVNRKRWHNASSPSRVSQFLYMETMPYMKLLIGSCLMFDIIYIISLYKTFKKEGKNPWTRKPLPGYVQSAEDPHKWVPANEAAPVEA